jgi:ceramide synthetase
MQLGYHLFSLFQHILKKPKNDYIEMLLHHLMTVALIGLAYFMNYVAISVIVLMVHDFSDVFGYIVRVFVDTNFKVVTLAAYLGLLISWLYLRLVVFPFDIIYYGLYLNLEIFDLPGTILLAVMLHCLVVLHLYWYYLFIQMGLKFLKTKTTQDTYHVE